MGFPVSLPWFLILSLLIMLMVGPAGAWTLQKYSVTPAGQSLPPGTPVSVSYSIYFDSWMTGTTFEKDDMLMMATDLTGAQWQVQKIEEMEGQEPVVESMPVRQSAQIRLDGWALSYSGKQFSLAVTMSGTTPQAGTAKTITILKLQETGPDAKVIPGTLIKKEAGLIVPTTVPTPVQTQSAAVQEPAPARTIVITPEITPAVVTTPTPKTTYSPGPDSLLLTGLLASLVLILAQRRSV